MSFTPFYSIFRSLSNNLITTVINVCEILLDLFFTLLLVMTISQCKADNIQVLWWMNNFVYYPCHGCFTCIYNPTIDSVRETRHGVKVRIFFDKVYFI